MVQLLQFNIPMTDFWKHKKYLWIILLIGFIIFLPILNNWFVWDDIPFILNNPEVHQFNLPILFGQNMFSSGTFYRPLQAIYFALSYLLFGQQAFFYHFIQLALHLAGTCILFIFFCLFFSEGISLFLALLFLVHPINVESVAWIAATTNQLYFCFGIAALLLATEKYLTWKKLSLVIVLLFLSVLSKEIGLSFIVLIIGYRYLFKVNKLKAVIVSAIGIGVAYALMRFFIGKTIYSVLSDKVPIAALPLWQRLLHIPAIFMFYLTTFIYPLHLDVMQRWVIKSLTVQNFLIPLFVSAALFILFLSLFYILYKRDEKQHVQERNRVNNNRKQPILEQKQSLRFAFFFLWFVIGMVPLLQVVPLDMTVAERFFYFPIVGLLGMLGIGLQNLRVYYNRRKTLYIAGAVIILALLSLRTIIRTFDWKNNLRLYMHDAKEENDNYFLMDTIAQELSQAGKTSEAVRYEEKSISLFPNFLNESHLGEIYLNGKQYDKAIIVYMRAIQLLNNDVSQEAKWQTFLRTIADKQLEQGNIQVSSAVFYYRQLDQDYFELANALFYAKHPNDAINFINSQALKKFPLDPKLYMLLAFAYINVQDHQKALDAITQAYKLSPDKTTESFYYKIKNNLPIEQFNNLDQKIGSSEASIKPKTPLIPPGWKQFTSAAMNLTFIYPQTFRLTQIKPHQVVSLTDPTHPNTENELLIYSGEIPSGNPKNLWVPFHLLGQLQQSKPVQLPGFQAVLYTYGDTTIQTQLLLLKHGQQLIVLYYPEQLTVNQKVLNQIVQSIATVH